MGMNKSGARQTRTVRAQAAGASRGIFLTIDVCGQRLRAACTGSSRGIFLTIDVVVAMMLLFTVVVLSFMYFAAPASPDFSAQLLQTYLQDAATAIANKGYFSSPLDSANNSNTSGMREMLAATPDSVCMQVSAYGTAVPEGLVGYWKLDQNVSGSVPDDSGNGASGILGGGTPGYSPAWTEGGKAGGAYVFDGLNDYISLGSPATFPDGNSSRTLCGWGKANSTAAGYVWIASYGYAGISNAMFIGRVGTALYGGGYGNDVTVADFWHAGVWNHICLTYDGSTARLYANGVQVASQAKSWYLIRDKAYIGKQVNGLQVWNGEIDEVRIYSRALSAAEIRELYSNQENLLYSVDKPDCAYSGGEMRSLAVPFLHSSQDADGYYYAVLKGWLKGARA